MDLEGRAWEAASARGAAEDEDDREAAWQEVLERGRLQIPKTEAKEGSTWTHERSQRHCRGVQLRCVDCVASNKTTERGVQAVVVAEVHCRSGRRPLLATVRGDVQRPWIPEKNKDIARMEVES